MRVIILVLGVLCSVAVAAGQNAEARFEVASIKPSASDGERSHCEVVVDHVWCFGHSMLEYIAIAHGVPTYLIADSPDWVTSERFDVEGQLPQGRRIGPNYLVDFPYPAVTRPQPPVANLLRERTGLRVHSETRALATYDLLPLRDDGQFGPSLCRGTGSECETRLTGRGGNNLRFVSDGVEWNGTLAATLSRELRRPVIDRTGLSGPFRLEVRIEATDRDPITLVAAVREQLGLALQESRAAMTVLVIDHIERPKGN